ncbi:fumarylacetoacetate hydrolase family protein [Pollutimonas harenae]|uniref:Fumarylacetoacetate hydrolase family protein n=1 Tax=Pollutimonas harenae TaxID=657015 RepID=A0A853GYR3_9BURK|nr:fumarylacetoacetate hydrolase family protein [Pollutimonas harenae]NYT84539.1 fumarylacetoacetate hydrolase family protein [Pollutimonas harenae]TEA73067.1 FAA hydrolase family protein [Pollutimonas harenae]
MKLLTFSRTGQQSRLGLMLEGQILDVSSAWNVVEHPLQGSPAPTSVLDVIRAGHSCMDALALLQNAARHRPECCVDADEVTFLPPIPQPPKNVICVGRNYKAHIVESNLARGRAAEDFPKAIELFTKPATTLVGHKQAVSRHAAHTAILDYEIELGVVIGKEGSNIDPADAMKYIFGYTIVNDITARDLQALHGQWFKGKSLDGTCPMGPVVVTKDELLDAGKLDLVLSVNGEVRQSSNTSDLLFDIPQIISQVSAGLTLQAGDIIATGTPSGVGFAMTPPISLESGDLISARIHGIGELLTTIAR